MFKTLTLGPLRLPIVGSLPFMGGSGPQKSLLHGLSEQVKKHGPIFGFYFGKTPNVVIADYSLVSKTHTVCVVRDLNPTALFDDLSDLMN